MFGTCSKGLCGFPPELLCRGSFVRILFQSCPEHFGCEIIAVGWYLPQWWRLIDNLQCNNIFHI